LNNKWQDKRPDSKFLNTAISDVETTVPFLVVDGDLGWESQLSGMKSTHSIDSNALVTEVSVKTVRLEKIWKENLSGSKVDVLFIDVEGHELNVLESNDWTTLRPKIIVIENGETNRNRDTVRQYLTSVGYKLKVRIWLCEDIFVDIT